MPLYPHRCPACSDVVDVKMSMETVGTVLVYHDHLTWSPLLSSRPMRDKGAVI